MLAFDDTVLARIAIAAGRIEPARRKGWLKRVAQRLDPGPGAIHTRRWPQGAKSCSPSRLASVLLGLSAQALGPPANHSQRKKIAERYANGETMAALAHEYGCGEAMIWRALHP
jgi:hypothetical protein